MDGTSAAEAAHHSRHCICSAKGAAPPKRKKLSAQFEPCKN